jgi:hypothetical protein
MSWRRIGLMYALCLVLGLYVYAMERGRDDTIEVSTETLSPLVPTLASRVTDLAFRWGDVVLRLRRDGEVWAVLEPQGVTITNDLVGAVLDTLTTIAPIDVVDDGTGDAAEFGLATPSVILRVSSDLEEPVDVAIGTSNPTRTAVYATRLDEDEVYVIGLAARYYVQLLFEELDGQLMPAEDSSAIQ